MSRVLKLKNMQNFGRGSADCSCLAAAVGAAACCAGVLRSLGTAEAASGCCCALTPPTLIGCR